MPRARYVVLLTALSLMLAACGGSTSDEAGADDATASGTESETGASGSSDGSGNYATVTIGGTTYEVPPDPLNLCNSLDTLISGSFALDAGGEVTQAGSPEASMQINFGIPVPEWEDEGLQPPILNVDLHDEGIRWFAGVDRGLGSVDSWQLNDGVATGSASFEAETVTGESAGAESGSFEIVCRQQG